MKEEMYCLTIGTEKAKAQSFYFNSLQYALSAWSEIWREQAIYGYITRYTDEMRPGVPLMDCNFNKLAKEHEKAFITLK